MGGKNSQIRIFVSQWLHLPKNNLAFVDFMCKERDRLASAPQVVRPLPKQGGIKQVDNCKEAALDEQNIYTWNKERSVFYIAPLRFQKSFNSCMLMRLDFLHSQATLSQMFCLYYLLPLQIMGKVKIFFVMYTRTVCIYYVPVWIIWEELPGYNLVANLLRISEM